MKIENKYVLQVLDLFTKALKRKDCSEIQIDNIDADSYNLWDGRTLECLDDNTTLTVPFDFSNFVKVLLEEYPSDLNYYENTNSISLKINLNQRRVKISAWYTSYGDEPQGESEYDMDDDFEKQLLDFLVDNDVEGAELVTIDFDGGGDSGWIEDEIYVRIGKDTVKFTSPAFIDDECYNILRSDYGGWEINEGSYGRFTISPSEKKIYLDFTYRTEESVEGILDVLEY